MKLFSNHRKKGFTLVEIIISLALLTIVLSVAFSFFLFSNSTYSKGVDQYSVQSSIRLASDYVIGQARYATKIVMMDSMDSDKISDPLNNINAYENYIYFKDGNIVRLSKYSQNTFNIGSGGVIEFSKSIDGQLLEVNVSGSDNGQNYNIDSEVKPLNLALEGLTIEGTGNSVIFYRTSDDFLSKQALPEATVGDPLNPEEVIVNFSKGILNVSIVADSETTPASSISLVDINHMKVNVVTPGAIDGRIITFYVTLDDNNLYEYSLKYTTQWDIE